MARMRETMPETAALVDELRQALGAAVVDRAIRAAAKGGSAFYAAELTADGELLEFGRTADGQRARAGGGTLTWPAPAGRRWPVPHRLAGTPTPTPNGSSPASRRAGNSSPDRALVSAGRLGGYAVGGGGR